MNKREAKELGRESGRNIASWIDVPKIGSKIPRHVDYVGYEVVTKDNLQDVMEMYASESESNARQFSPFEFTAHDINECPNADVLWDAYDNGVSAGIRQEIRKRLRN